MSTDKKTQQSQYDLSEGLKSEVVAMAWCDKTSFDDIQRYCDLAEKDVIKLMRTELKASSFRLWRKRVSGRLAKHKKKQVSNDETLA